MLYALSMRTFLLLILTLSVCSGPEPNPPPPAELAGPGEFIIAPDGQIEVKKQDSK